MNYLLRAGCLLFIFLSITKASTAQSAAKEIHCTDSLWAHVYNSSRLIILEKCIQVTGVVMSKKKEDDGDMHILLKLDKGQETRLIKGNYDETKGFLVVEIICENVKEKDRSKYACTDYVNQIRVPKIGKHVRVTGTYVMDKHHNWAEVHPVSKLKVLKD